MSQYATSFASPQGPGDARPTAFQIMKDLNLQDALPHTTAVITGVSSGLGIETARVLSASGMTLYLTARDLSKAHTALASIMTPNMHLIEMDNSSLSSVRTAANTILSQTDKINILINNAGVMAIPSLTHTPDGFESQFGVNHLSHFLFFQLLKPALVAAAKATPGFPSRVVNVSASAHRLQTLNNPNNYNYSAAPEEYTPWGAYAQSKTANIYMSSYIDRHFSSQGVRACSLHPGIIGTGIGQFVPPEMVKAITEHPYVQKIAGTVEQGAASTVWCALSEGWDDGEGGKEKGGKYCVNCTIAEEGEDDGDRTSLKTVSWTYDQDGEEKLWRDSLKLVGLEDGA
jgi:NAD(P)-dependent dehydrogenase (short-subunit alcohol dehydrogenase family)